MSSTLNYNAAGRPKTLIGNWQEEQSLLVRVCFVQCASPRGITLGRESLVSTCLPITGLFRDMQCFCYLCANHDAVAIFLHSVQERTGAARSGPLGSKFTRTADRVLGGTGVRSTDTIYVS